MVMAYQDRHPLSTSTTVDKIYARNLIAIKVVQSSLSAAETGLQMQWFPLRSSPKSHFGVVKYVSCI